MADAQTFEEFVTTRSPAFLRLAYALTRDHASAEDLLQTALARTWPAWKRICGDPEPYVRRVLVNTHNSWWRRRWNGERATGELPDAPSDHPQSTVDDRDEVWRALSRLPKRQQAVLVLRFFEDLSEAQIAETLGMAPGTVKSYAAKGLARLRRDPSLVPGLLEIPPAPEGVERLTAVKERIKQGRRTRAITVAAVIVALIALLLGSSPLIKRLSLEPAGPGGFPKYRNGHQVVAGQRVSFAQIRSGAYFTWTPGSWVPQVYIMCTHSRDGGDAMVRIEVNGDRFGGVQCAHDGSLSLKAWHILNEERLRGAGVELGVPVHVKIVFDERRGPIPDNGIAAVGIGEPVPWQEYPFPHKPWRLKTLARETFRDFDGPILEASGARSTEVHWSSVEVRAQTQTPGLLHIHVNGVRMLTLSWWDYDAGVKAGDLDLSFRGPVTLTVIPEHLTGDWIVVVSRVS